MKNKLWILFLLLVTLVTMAVACDKKTDTPVDSSDEITSDAPAESITEGMTAIIPVTEPETPATTEPETNTPPAEDTETETTTDSDIMDDPISDPDLDMEDIIFSVMNTEQFDLLGSYHLQTDLSMDMIISIMGMETKVTLTGDMSMKQQAGEAAEIIMNLPTQEPYSMAYLDGMLYVTSDSGKYRCPLDEADQSIIWSEILGGLFPSENIPEADSDLSDVWLSEIMSSLLSAMDVSLVFENTVAVEDETTGDITITLEGLTRDAQYVINELISSMGNEEIADEDMSLMLELLSAFDMDTLALSMTVDEDMLMRSVSLTFAMNVENMSDLMGGMTQIPSLGTDVPVTMVTTMTTTFDRGEQEITAPADADIYEETNWRELFGFYTAEMLGLVPNEKGVITLSEDPDVFARQYEYIVTHPTEFSELTLSVTGRAYDFSAYNDGSVNGYLYQVYEDGSAAEDTYLPVLIPAELAAGITLPQNEATVKLMLIMTIEAHDGYEYLFFVATDYEFIRDPVAVG